LHEAGEGSWGTEESIFHQILVGRSVNQLRATFQQYLAITDKTIEHSIESEMSGELKMGMLAIVKSINNRQAFLAERLYKAMKEGLGTDDKTLIRIVTTRAEWDLRLIMQEFESQFGRTLQHWIAGETSGDYKRVLLALCR
jgi:annexin A7/11